MAQYYFAEDGNWGDHTDLVVVDEDNVDPHFFDEVDKVSDTERRNFAEWFKDNSHEAELNADGDCSACSKWID